METKTIRFTASGQKLAGECLHCASNTVAYIVAEFDLDDNWKSFDAVRAVWKTDFACISTVLDFNGACTVPHEVLARRDYVSVNLVGSDVVGDELVDRLTSYPVDAIHVDASALICGTETAKVTPSQFEQFVGVVSDAAEQAAISAQGAATSASDAADAKTAAQNAAGNAAQSATDAAASALDASDSASAAQKSAQDADDSADRAEQAAASAGYMSFSINNAGHLIYERTDNVDVDFSLVNGHLVMEV